MNEIFLPLIAGLVGALIGAAGSVATVWIQSRQETRRQRIRLAVEAAIHDQSVSVDAAKASGAARTVAPLSLFMFHHAELLELVENRLLSAPTFRLLMEQQRRLEAAIDEAEREAAEAKAEPV